MSVQPAATAKPDYISLDALLEQVAQGVVRIPRFQRPYVWSQADMVNLFDSVVRGYPIGSLLLWQTESPDIQSVDQVGPIRVPKSKLVTRSFVIDGHQRLATLFGVLRLPEDHPRINVEDWRWWIGYDLKSGSLIQMERKKYPVIPLSVLPLRIALRSSDYNRRCRDIIASQELSDEEKTNFIDKADEIIRAIREYRIALTVMLHGTLDDAASIFSRINIRGRDMTDDQMYSALTYRESPEDVFNLADVITEIIGTLREFSFGNVARKLILQTILVMADLDYTKTNFAQLEKIDSHQKLAPAAQDARKSLHGAVKFLRDTIGLGTSRLLPYGLTLFLLAVYFKESPSPELSNVREAVLKRWFWGTSVNGWCAGANSTDVRKAVEAMRAFARSGSDQGAINAFEGFFLDRPLRPFPEVFDRRSARIRALLLVQILQGRPKDPNTGKEIDGFEVIANEDTRDIPYFFTKKPKPRVSSPANRVILGQNYGRTVKRVFVNIKGTDRDQILASHCLSEAALVALKQDDFDTFITEREKSLRDLESDYLKQFSLVFDPEVPRSREEIDTDD